MINQQKIKYLSNINNLKRKKKTLNYQFDKIINKIKKIEMDKLKNPKNGDIFVHVNSENEYFFFQYCYNKWNPVTQ